eukprot:TRINITY_DN2550_c0_g1_i1.p1 TRINITY_DN2550_c0_g1~~TRINITY_DN2550_c0_g1_i1.p1  ORF type:complete len:1296 (-),score=384.75 TRINITY_DN2550_c0_g1_i1:28-3915(-)
MQSHPRVGRSRSLGTSDAGLQPPEIRGSRLIPSPPPLMTQSLAYPRAIAIQNFFATSRSEVSILVGNEVRILNRNVDGNYVRVQTDTGGIGLIPEECLALTSSVSSSRSSSPRGSAIPRTGSTDSLASFSDADSIMTETTEGTVDSKYEYPNAVEIAEDASSEEPSQIYVSNLVGRNRSTSDPIRSITSSVSELGLPRQMSMTVTPSIKSKISLEWVNKNAGLGFLVFPIRKIPVVNFLTNEKQLDYYTIQGLTAVQKERDQVMKSMKSSLEMTIPSLESYLPTALGLVNAYDILEQKEGTKLIVPNRKGKSNKLKLIFSWTSSVGSQNYSHGFDCESPRFDYLMLLNAYALSMVNLAEYLVHGTKSSDSEFSEATNFLRRAAGVVRHIAQEGLSAWRIPNSFIRPPELMENVLAALEGFFLAEAQMIIVGKMIRENTLEYVQLSSLCVGIVKLITDSQQTIQGNKFSFDNLNTGSKIYIGFQLYYHQALSYYFRGLEFLRQGKNDEAHPYLKHAMEIIKKTPTLYKAKRTVLNDVRKSFSVKLKHAIKTCSSKTSFRTHLQILSGKSTSPLPEPEILVSAIEFLPSQPAVVHINRRTGSARFILPDPLILNSKGLEIQSVIQCESRCGMLTHRSPAGVGIKKSWKKGWFEIKEGYMLLYKNQPLNGEQPRKVVALDGATISSSEMSKKTRFTITSSKFTRNIRAADLQELEEWVRTFTRWAHTSHQHGSYAPLRQNIECNYFIDAQPAYEAMAAAMETAQLDIFISGWFLIPEIYLKRDSQSSHGKDRLDQILKSRAEKGIQIYVLLWNESVSLNLKSLNTKKRLESLHPNIRVVRHASPEGVTWSHHQKICVIDRDLAFLGSVDLAYGRFDTSDHVIVDPCHLNPVWPGKDFGNPNLKGMSHAHKPWDEELERDQVPRMGWHGVHISVTGDAARDVSYNFIQRWNHHKTKGYPEISPKFRDRRDSTSPGEISSKNQSVQILRSLSEWSGGNRRENSLYKAILDSVQNAEHFVYIETSNLISSLAGFQVENRIMEVLLQKIQTAIEAGRMFRVVIVLPTVPDANYKSSATARSQMKWQYETLCRGGNSIVEQLRELFKNINPYRYITFHSLRNYGFIEDLVLTEQIYVDSKVVIVDDRVAIIGSSNLNDRGLRGDRDSEIGCIIQNSAKFPSKMNNQDWEANEFSLNLRLSLWKEHLGLSDADVHLIQDPISDATYEHMWQKTSSSNTLIFNQVFPGIPNNSISTFSELKAREKEDIRSIESLHGIRGHVIDFPVDFLKDETLGQSSADATAFV